MANQQQFPKPWRFIPGPVPKVWGFVVTVSDDQLNAPSDFPTEGETAYKDFPLNEGGRVQDYGDYIYTGPAEAPIGFQAFYFGPNNIDPNVPLRTTLDFGNHPWPDVLLAIEWYRDTSFPIATPSTDGTNLGMTFGQRYYERKYFIPGATEGTLFTTLEFYSPTIFNIGQHPTPVPTEVSWDFLGQKGSIGSCLHPKIDIKAKISAMNAYYSTGVVPASSVAGDQVFPETNFTNWARYCVYDQQKFVGIGWHRIQKWVKPPPQPDIIKSR